MLTKIRSQNARPWAPAPEAAPPSLEGASRLAWARCLSAGFCVAGMGLLPGLASAQDSATVLAHPTVTSLVRALGEAPAQRALRGIASARKSSLPDQNHVCAGGSGDLASRTSKTRNLVVVPYETGHAVNVNLAVQFATGSDQITAEGRDQLDTVAAAMNDPRLAKARFAVAGHTDLTGTSQINLPLSCARAIAVRNYLIQSGVAAERLSAYGFGSDSPLNTNQADAPENRRVELRRDIGGTDPGS